MAGLFTCNLVAISHLIYLRKDVNAQHGASVLPFGGMDLDGNAWNIKPFPCYLLRVTSDDCAYCIRDRGSYDELVEAARSAQCEIIEVAPRAGQMASNPRAGIVQLKYVTRALNRELVTPETIILDRGFSERWSNKGVISRTALNEGLSVLQVLSQH